MLSSIGTSKITTNRRVTLPAKAQATLGLREGDEIAFFKDEYGRIIVDRVKTESILSKLELPEKKPAVQKVFP